MTIVALAGWFCAGLATLKWYWADQGRTREIQSFTRVVNDLVQQHRDDVARIPR